MTFIQLKLWDLRPAPPAPPAPTPPPAPRAQRGRSQQAPRAKAPGATNTNAHANARTRPNAVPLPAARPQPAAPPNSARERYERMTRHALSKHRVRVRKWRTSMSGVAWQVTYTDGSVARLIEAPRPKGPVSAAIFLHEIGHHAIGFNVYKLRCLEEYHAWMWSLHAMERYGLDITDMVLLRVHESLHYAIDKARRRGLKGLPAELLPYAKRPPERKPRRTA